MSKDGSYSLGSGRVEDGNKFGFIDADNMEKGFQHALTRRGIEKIDIPLFDLNKLFIAAPLDRRYIFGAVSDGSEPQPWIVEARSQDNFVFRQGLLKSSGKKRKQEGVDVLLALEAVKCAQRNTMQHATIFSGDGDLLPLVEALVDMGIFTTVASYDDPEKGDVASRLRDAADRYVHIGTRILQGCIANAHGLSTSGAAQSPDDPNFGLRETIGELENGFMLGKNTHDRASIFKKRGMGVNRSITYWNFHSEQGAKLWFQMEKQKFTGSRIK